MEGSVEIRDVYDLGQLLRSQFNQSQSSCVVAIKEKESCQPSRKWT